MHSNNDDPTGRHPDKTEAAIPKALNERADLVGQSYRERHRGQRAIGLQLKAGHMGAPLPYGVELKRALDRGVVPHMGIPNLVAAAELEVNFAITNTGDGTLPASIGAHPAFIGRYRPKWLRMITYWSLSKKNANPFAV